MAKQVLILYLIIMKTLNSNDLIIDTQLKEHLELRKTHFITERKVLNVNAVKLFYSPFKIVGSLNYYSIIVNPKIQHLFN